MLFNNDSSASGKRLFSRKSLSRKKLSALIFFMLNSYNLTSNKTAKGIEIDYDTRVNDRFAWWANASFADSNEVIEPGVAGGGIWNRQMNLGLDFKADENWSFYTASRFIGPRSPRNDGGDPEVDKVFVHNAGLKYAHSRSSEIRLDAINIFDKEYSTSHATVGTAKMETPPRGRKIFLSYRIKF
jgi:outer membrane receptor protein involved in Fe transport